MVDLAKIRKKAKKVAETVVETVTEKVTEAIEAVTPHANEVATQGNEVATSQSPEAEHPATRQPGNPATPTQQPSNPATQQPSTQSETKLAKFKEEAGRKRDSLFAATSTEDTAAVQLELLTFVLAAEHYAVDIERIVEIVTPRAVTRVPNADPSIVGIMSLRGTVVTLLDVRRQLHHPPAPAATDDTRIVVVDLGNETVGFTVDRVLRVIKLGIADLEPHPVVHLSEQDEAIRGVFRHAGALTILLDLEKLLANRASSMPVA